MQKNFLTYMRTRNGAMPYGDKSDPEDIRERFQMSKAAFKRALGHLMKNDLVYQKKKAGHTTRKSEHLLFFFFFCLK
ncbi:hypothetical protein BsIDN1_20370 [Bacillus safensis]|uniref:Conserved virulence factor B-like winged helix domain-containing protein n=1 Tax=Bacillus safensis TaxID=561879 RepID=A0A5S9M902_BACIA|nr:hypothetical protein BsIDN1_20370 [Bacillus safensis]